MLARNFNRARTYVSSSGLGPAFVRSIVGTSAVRLASMVASFGVGVQLARGLGVEGYGYYGLALSVITIAGIPGELGLSKLVTREVATASARQDYAKLFGVLRWADRTCWIVSAFLALVVAIAAIVLLERGSVAVGTAILLGIPTIPLLALSRIQGGGLQGLQDITLGQVPANLLRPLLLSICLFAASIAGMFNASMAMALNSLTAGMVYVVAYLLLSKRLPRPAPTKLVKDGKRWLASTIPLALTDGMRMLQLELTTILLGLLTVASDVGLFRIAVVTATMAAAPMMILNRVNMPMIARLHAQGDKRLQKVVTYSAYAQATGVLLMSLPLLVIPGWLLSLVFGESFAPAADALRIISLGQIANAAFGPNVALLNMTHHERRVTRAMIIGVTLNVVTVLLLGKVMGIEGAALGFVASLLTWNFLTWLDARQLLSIETSVLGGLLAARK